MAVRAGILTLLVLIFSTVKAEKNEGRGILSVLENKFENKAAEFTNYVTQRLENYNDKYLGGKSELGRFLHYEDLKARVEATGSTGRMKKMSMAIIPLIFHVGAASTVMLLTLFLAAKSVAIGILLLIFKIAVSSAKLASFFTILKGKHFLAHHHEYTPHYEHHGHKRSLEFLEHPTIAEHPTSDISYAPHSAPEWSKEPPYPTAPLAYYKQASEPYEYAAESKTSPKKVEKIG